VNSSRALALAVLALLIVVGCKSEPKVPSIVSLTGPADGSLGDTLDFKVKGEDPDGRDLSYEMDWGDTSSLAWTAPHPSGKEVTLQHVYADTGLFRVRAKARTNAENESEWSDSIQVHVQVERPPMPVVSYEAVDTGRVLRVSWTAVPQADSYWVTFDGTKVATTNLTMDVGGPARQVSVCAFRQNTRSDDAIIDCTPVISTITAYSKSDTTQPCAFGFTTDGTITTYRLQQQNYTYLDLVLDDEFYTPVGLINAGDYGWPQNEKVNTLIDAGATDFNAFELAAAPGSGFMTQLQITPGGLYALWLSVTYQWNTGDRYCKAKVVTIEQSGSAQKVTLKIAYQKIGGLRWLKTQ